MDHTPTDSVRIRLIIGKFQVLSVEPGLTGFKAKVAMGNSVTMTMDCPISVDVRVGDLLTFYTEVPLHAEPEPTSVQ